ncbi:MAG: beta-lactamase family protein [Clostridiales bacterium]|nr:beta-lactamase family protein [Clostridiales bacterium]
MTSLESFDRILEKHISDKEMAGASYIIYRKGSVIFENHIGYGDIENNRKLTPDTIMRLASMTKPITSAAVMVAREMNLLSLDDLVSKYIPGFKRMNVAEFENGKLVGIRPSGTELRIIDLLNHTNGLGAGSVPQIIATEIGETDTLATGIPKYASQILDFEPRTAIGYSGTMAFDVACRIVEIVSGAKYEEFIRKYILLPLEMNDTGYDLTQEQEKRLAVMYHCESGEIKVSRPDQLLLPNVPRSYKCGGTQMFSTIADYSRFVLMLAGNGEFEGIRVLSSESVEMMSHSTLPENLQGLDYYEWGIGMRVLTKKRPPEQVLNPGAYGWSGAYETHFFIDPSLDICALLFKNVSSGLGAGAVTARELEREVMAVLG